MNRNIRSRRGLLPSAPVGILGILLVLTVSLLAAGCLESYPTAPPTISGETAAPTQPLQPIPPTVSVQAEAPISGYIERSFGYVLYTTPPDNRLTYINASATKDASGMVTITGRIKNEGPGSLNYLHVTYTLFDSDGNVLGNTHASVEYLQQGKTWRFTTEPVKADTYQYFELAEVLKQ